MIAARSRAMTAPPNMVPANNMNNNNNNNNNTNNNNNNGMMMNNNNNMMMMNGNGNMDMNNFNNQFAASAGVPMQQERPAVEVLPVVTQQSVQEQAQVRLH
jgi:hypothetical protein